MKEIVVCKICKRELTQRPTDCGNNACPYKKGGEESSFWDMLDLVEKDQPTGCLNIFPKGDGCLSEFGGCLILPFKWMFHLIVGFFKILGKILDIFD